MTNTELLDGVVELLDAGTAYYTAVQTIIPQAVSSESAFTRYYERLVRRPGDPPAVTFLLGFDSAPIRAEQSLFDLAAWARTRPALADALRGASPRHGGRDRRRRADRPAWTPSRGRSGATGSERTSTCTGTPSTTSTSRTRSRRTTRHR